MTRGLRLAGLGACLLMAAYGAAPPRRIVSLSPNVTEMLFGIGAFDSVVGVSDYCTYPPQASSLPSVGGWTNPNLEKLTALRPDLVIVDEGQAPLLTPQLGKLSLAYLIVADETVDDVYRALDSLGAATGHAAAAGRLAQSLRDRLAGIQAATARLPRPRVVMIVDRAPGTLRDLVAATPGSFLSQLIQIAGGQVVLAPAPHGYERLNKEDLLAANPEWILDFSHGGTGRLAGDGLAAWQELPQLAAVRERHVTSVQEDYVPHASQRMVQTATLFEHLLHPGTP